MAELERGVFFTVNGQLRKVCVTILLWLVDHVEGNKVCHLSSRACRHCIELVSVSRFLFVRRIWKMILF